MASVERFQAGERYGEDEELAYSLSDPVDLARGILKELAGVRTQVSLSELVGIIKTLKEKPLDDRKG